jgi:hypothetical protein
VVEEAADILGTAGALIMKDDRDMTFAKVNRVVVSLVAEFNKRA